jgi:hypothetical protein
MVFLFLFVGSVVVNAAPQYEANELAVFKVKVPVAEKNEKYGYLLLNTGKWVIPPKFDEARNFTDNGRASVGIISKMDGFSRRKYGYIDLQGNIVINPDLISCSPRDFSEGLVAVRINGVDGYIDSYGNRTIDLTPDAYVDSDGKKIIDLNEIRNKMPGFITFGSFHEGMAEVKGMATYGFINKMGELIIEPKFSGWGLFSEDVAVVKEDRGHGNVKWGVIDKSGAYVLVSQYAFLKNFTEDVAAVQVEANGKWGFIDKKGEIVIEAQYLGAGSFHNGLAPVMENDKWGFIDKTGKVVISPQFDTAGDFKDGIAKVQLDQKYGWINTSGNWVIEPVYSSSAVYWPAKKIIFDSYYYDTSGKKLNHYVNHMIDATQYMKDYNYKAAEVAFKEALKINPMDEAASWGLRLAEDSQK